MDTNGMDCCAMYESAAEWITRDIYSNCHVIQS